MPLLRAVSLTQAITCKSMKQKPPPANNKATHYCIQDFS